MPSLTQRLHHALISIGSPAVFLTVLYNRLYNMPLRAGELPVHTLRPCTGLAAILFVTHFTRRIIEVREKRGGGDIHTCAVWGVMRVVCCDVCDSLAASCSLRQPSAALLQPSTAPLEAAN